MTSDLQTTNAAVGALFHKWLERTRANQLQHYAAATYYNGLHKRLGVPTTVFSLIVGSTVFASLQKQIDTPWQVLVGVLSIVAAILAGLQTYLKHSELAEKHRTAGAAYAAIRHQLEVVISFGELLDVAAAKSTAEKVEKEIDTLAGSAPTVPPAIWAKVNRSVKEEGYFLKSGSAASLAAPATASFSPSDVRIDPNDAARSNKDPHPW